MSVHEHCEERDGFAGARRTLEGLGGHVRAPHVDIQ